MALDTISIARLEITKIYIAAFNRAPDAAGLSNWMNQYTAGLMTYTQISEDFSNQAEYKAKYPSAMTNSEYITEIYTNVFGRTPDAGGLTNWVNQLDASATTGYTRGNIMKAMLDAAGATGNTDGIRLTNQATFAVQAVIVDGVSDVVATAQLANITSDAATVTTANAAVLSSANVGTAYTLTTAVDSFLGTTANDTFSAANGTFTSLDTVDGGAGTDTFTVATTGNYTLPTGATVTNIENFTVAADGTNTIDTTTGFAGLTSITAIGAGGTNVTAASTTSITATNTGANAMAIIGGGGTGTFTTGGAAVTVGQTAVVNAYTAVSVVGGSTVDISDNATTAKADGTTLKTVSLKGNTGIATLDTDGLTTLNLVNNTQNVTINAIAGTRALTINESATTGTSTLADALATSVTLNHTGTTDSVGITLNAAAATTVTINSDGTLASTTAGASALTIADVNIAAATTLNFTGTTKTTLTATSTITALTDIVSTNTAGVTITAALATADKFTGGAGADTIELGASTVVSTMGAGDDTVIITTALGALGTVDGGDGTDTISMTTANAVTLSAATALAADISSFEVVSLGQIIATQTTAEVKLANLDNINSVKLAGALDNTAGASILTISGFATGGTFEQTAALLGATNVNSVTLTGAFTGGADAMTLKATATNGFANVSVLTLADVENVTIVLDDSDTTAATTMFDLNLDATSATTVTVSGDAGITFANSSLTAVRTMDASGVTAAGTAGVVTFTANAGMDTVIKGGAGNDVLTGNTGNDTITVVSGTNTLNGGAGNDSITGGTGADSITGAAGVDTLTGAGGIDTFVFANGNSVLTGGAGTTGFDTIVDYTTGVDKIDNGGTIVLAASADAAGKATVSATGLVTGFNGVVADYDTFAEKVDQIDLALGGTAERAALFTDSGKTYLYISVGTDATNDGTDTIIELTGVTATAGITIVGGDITAIA